MKWKPAPGFEKTHLISSCGKIKTTKGVFLKQSNGGYKRRYLIVNIKQSGTQNMTLVHRLVAKAFVENPEEKPQVNHKDGNQHNNHYSNLEWVTPKEHGAHSSKYGLCNRGSRVWNVKYTEADILRMRALYKRGKTATEIARMYNTNVQITSPILRYKKWAWLTEHS